MKTEQELLIDHGYQLPKLTTRKPGRLSWMSLGLITLLGLTGCIDTTFRGYRPMEFEWLTDNPCAEKGPIVTDGLVFSNSQNPGKLGLYRDRHHEKSIEILLGNSPNRGDGFPTSLVHDYGGSYAVVQGSVGSNCKISAAQNGLIGHTEVNGVDPQKIFGGRKLWSLNRSKVCDPDNKGNSGEQWAVLSVVDGRVVTSKFVNDLPDPNCHI